MTRFFPVPSLFHSPPSSFSETSKLFSTFSISIFHLSPSFFGFGFYFYISSYHSLSPFIQRQKSAMELLPPTGSLLFPESPSRIDIIGPEGFINVESQWLNGTTLHLHGSSFSRYKGYPKCFTRNTHTSAEQCLRNYDATDVSQPSGHLLNFWMHYPADGSEAWLQKEFIYLLDPVALKHVQETPGFIVYLPRCYATLVEKYMYRTHMRIMNKTDERLDKAIPDPTFQELFIWNYIIRSSSGRRDPKSKVVLCQTLLPPLNTEDCVSQESNTLYKLLNDCPIFEYLETGPIQQNLPPDSDVSAQLDEKPAN